MVWRLGLATRLSREFKSRANGLASLGLFSCSATASMTHQLPCMLRTCANFDGLPIASPNRKSLHPCTILSISSHSLTHYPYIVCHLWRLASCESQPQVSASLHNLKHSFTLTHSLPLHDSHLNTGLLIAKIQANLARNKANKMVDKIQPYRKKIHKSLLHPSKYKHSPYYKNLLCYLSSYVYDHSHIKNIPPFCHE